MCSEKACISLAEAMRWKLPGNLVPKMRESHDTQEAFPRDTFDQEEMCTEKLSLPV